MNGNENSPNVPNLRINVPELSSKQYDIGMTVNDNSPSLSSKHGLSCGEYDICWDVNDDPCSIPSLSSEEKIDNRILKEDRKQNKKGMAPEHKLLILGKFSIVGV